MSICANSTCFTCPKQKHPYVLFRIGRWWDNYPVKHKQDDIAILALDRTGKHAIFCECKFRNELFDMQEYRVYIDACVIFKHIEEWYYLFVKSKYTKDVQEMPTVDEVKLLTVE